MKRFLPIAAVIVIAVVAFIVINPGDDKKKTSSTATPPTNSTQKGKPAKPQVIQIKVQGGKPVGGIKPITVNKGDEVRFAVSSDVADEIHVHGYDFMKDVKAGGKVSFDFPAKIDGEFEIELEERAEQIAKLTVNP
jgi:heme/copper-type cytochrome/quinol oxidase subunit 2